MTGSPDLDWLFSRQRFGVHPGLERVRVLLARLGHPQQRFGTVLVGGTNGKGSTAASLAAMLRADGRRVGLFTSPHLTRFTERFRVDGDELPAQEVDAALSALRPHAEATGATFFEIVTALGAALFARAGVDLAVMEVGLGGRLDATNALDPQLSVVTNVGLDHPEVLGHTLEAISAEKAGILRAGVPAVVGVDAPLVPLFRRTGAEVWALGAELSATVRPLGWAGAEVELNVPGAALTLRTPLLGRHGGLNAGLAAAAALRLGATPEAIREGAAAVRWPGRLEALPWAGGQVLLDGAHNPDGARAVVATLRELGVGEPGAGGLPLVFGGAADKDLAGIAAALRPLVSQVILTRAALSPRAADPVTLAGLFPGVPVTLTATPAQALAALAGLRAPLALACGSLYLVGELRPLLLGEVAEGRERWQ